MTLMKILSPPSEVLVKLYLGLSTITLAKRLTVLRTWLQRLVRGEASVTVDTASGLPSSSATRRSSG